MNITSDHLEALRTFFTDPDEHIVRTNLLAAKDDLDGYWAMVAATLVVLVKRRFAGPRRSGDVTRWVARTRARLSTGGGPRIRLHAEAAEELIRIVLGAVEPSDRLYRLDRDVRGETQFLLLGLLYDDIGRPDLDQLLEAARTLAVSSPGPPRGAGADPTAE